MSDRLDAMAAELATMARRLGCWELALAYEETRYLGAGGRVTRGNFDERRAEFELLWEAVLYGRLA